MIHLVVWRGFVTASDVRFTTERAVGVVDVGCEQRCVSRCVFRRAESR